MTKETCVMCGVGTPYDFQTHIDLREGYIEGLGQLCQKCYSNDTTDTLCIPKTLIKKTPNDMQLGEKIRRLFNRD